ncbi:MAG TPA: hypothetical protein ENJ95_18035, partial [Bacteroidetes bacterium]|nr:hypothetical protein [Bacteroidota bacterium]
MKMKIACPEVNSEKIKKGCTLPKGVALFISVFIFIFIFKNWLFEKTVTYVPMAKQHFFAATDTAFLSYIAQQKTNENIESIIRQALEMTAGQLEFSSSKNNSDPNVSFYKHKAHCVGYAAFFSTSCNGLLKKAGLGNTWQASHWRGKIYFLGINLHRFSNAPFF